MRAVIHIGTGKAGSTTLQKSYGQSRDALLKHGILVPTAIGDKQTNKKLAHALNGSASPEEGARALGTLAEEIEGTNPDTLYFSSEYLWPHTDRIDHLRETLSRFASEIQIEMLVREPTAFYRAVVQQFLKTSEKFPSPMEWDPALMDRINAWHGAFGEAFTLIGFQRSTLFEGCVVKDTAHRYFPQVLDDPECLKIVESNISDTPEVSSISQDYHRVNYPKSGREQRTDTTALRTQLNWIASEIGAPMKAKLRPQARDIIVGRNSELYLELRDKWNIEFDGVDYASLPFVTATAATGSFKSFDAVCEVNVPMRKKMLMRLTYEQLKKSAKPRKN